MSTNDTSAINCCVCCKDIPLDAAFTPEGIEYVQHFCGLECYQRFVARAKDTVMPMADLPVDEAAGTFRAK